MNKRIVIWLLTTFLLTTVSVAEAQPAKKLPRIGLLRLGSPPDRVVDVFREGLRDLGYVEGQNIVIEYRWAHGKVDPLPELAAELVRLRVDVIVTHGPPGIGAAKEATSTIPIVMGRMDDADVHGFVASLARPGGNITGLSFQTGDLSGKCLELLTEVVPKLSNVAVLWDATGTANQLKTIEATGRSLSVRLQVLKVRSLMDFDRAFEAAGAAQTKGLVILGSPLLSLNASRLAGLATKHRLPAIYYRAPLKTQ